MIQIEIISRRNNTYDLTVRSTIQQATFYCQTIEGAKSYIKDAIEVLPSKSVGGPSLFYKIEDIDSKSFKVNHLTSNGDIDRVTAIIKEV